MDVSAWLRGLGLEQYAPAFRDNDVDGEVLPELTADDLISIGVTSVGHRRKLLAAIAALGMEPTRDSLQPAVSATSAPISPPTIDAERRQLTVMFCDLVGSTALSARLDPEDLREVIGAYHRCCADLITEAGGFVAKYMGDGVLAYFGYPLAHEHDAEHAVQAGLALVEAMPKLTTVACRSSFFRLAMVSGPNRSKTNTTNCRYGGKATLLLLEFSRLPVVTFFGTIRFSRGFNNSVRAMGATSTPFSAPKLTISRRVSAMPVRSIGGSSSSSANGSLMYDGKVRNSFSVGIARSTYSHPANGTK
jgi:hypothetical protein